MISKREALNLFQSLSDFSNVEWALSKYNDGSFSVRTDHKEGAVVEPRLGTYEWNIHSHPGDSGFEGTMGASGNLGLSNDGQMVYVDGDMNNIKVKLNQWINMGYSHSSFPMHYVYHKKSKSVYFYNAYKPDFKCYLNSVGNYRKEGKE